MNGAERHYVAHPPRNHDKRVLAPLIVMLTEQGAKPSAFDGRSDIIGGSSKLGYVLAVPEAQGSGWEHGVCGASVASSDAGEPVAKKAKKAAAAAARVVAKTRDAALAGEAAPAADQNADVAFIASIIDDAGKNYAIDSGRVYLLGTDAGAALAARAARALPGKISALALNTSGPLCSNGRWELPASSATQPVFVIQSEAGSGQDGGSGQQDGAAVDAAQALAPWLESNECTPPAEDAAATLRLDYVCRRGAVASVEAAKRRGTWPRKIGKLFTLRVIHNFFTAQER